MPYTDDDLREHAGQAADALIRLATWTAPGWGDGPSSIRQLVTDQATQCMTLDPTKIQSELDRMREAVKLVDPHRDPIFTATDESLGTLRKWTGAAAEAFRERTRKIVAFQVVQYQRSLAYPRALAALSSLAAQVRADYCSLALATVAAADTVRGNAREEGRMFALKVGAALAKAAFGGFKLSDIGSAGTDIAVEGITLHVTGTTFEEVIASYQESVGKLTIALAEGFGQISADLHEVTDGNDDTRKDLVSPLPPSTDITSPDFRYEAFATSSRPVDVFSQPVAEEKERVKRAFDDAKASPISLRLAGEAE